MAEGDNGNNFYQAKKNNEMSNNKTKDNESKNNKNLGKDGTNLPQKNKHSSDTSTSDNSSKSKASSSVNNGNKNSNNKNNNSNKNNRNDLAKKKAATAALSTVMSAPLAKMVANTAMKQNAKKNQQTEEERKKIIQNQDRINAVRNAFNNKKEGADEESEQEENNNNSGLDSEIKDITDKLGNVKGTLMIKNAPAPVKIILVALLLFLFILIMYVPLYTAHANQYGIHTLKSKISKLLGSSSTSSSTTTSGDGLAKGTLIAPISGKYYWSVSGLYYSGGKYHGGNDISVSEGSTVVAMDGGVVVSADTTTNKKSSCSSGYHTNGYCSFGKFVGIKHEINGKTYYSVYAHLSSISVKVGDKVSQGQEIAKSGNTGNSTGPHLHIGFSYNAYSTTSGAPIYNKNIINPYDYIDGSRKGQTYTSDTGSNY